jgi:glycosyltransferase involved in cell wall biosynthesis
VVIEREANGGRAAACNSALGVARGELILILDDDVVLEPGLLIAHVNGHKQAPGSALMGLSFPRSPGRPTAFDVWSRKRYAKLAERLVLEGGIRSPREASTVNLSVSRTTSLAVGGFCEEFQRYGKEDVEFVHRLAKAGVELRLLPQAVLYHWLGKSLALYTRQRADVARNDLILQRLHPELAPLLECSVPVSGRSSWKGSILRALCRALDPSDETVDRVLTLAERVLVPGSRAADRTVEYARMFGYYRGLWAAADGSKAYSLEREDQATC